jgi:hypothetical protein
MKRSLLALVLAFLFFAPAASSQVMIPDSVAVYYLEQNERVKILTKAVAELRAEIHLLEMKVQTGKEIQGTFQTDRLTYEEKLQVKLEELTHKEELLKEAKKEIRKLKRQLVFTYIGAGLLLLLTLLFHG